MRLQDLNWMDVERYLERDNRIILITGATEQHAYLSLWTDILIPSRIALAVAERENVLVAPPLNFGMSEYFIDFPGTITLSQSTFGLVLSEMVDSLAHQGFKRFFILNGHGGNQQPQHLIDLDREGTIRVAWYNWWRESAVKQFSAEQGLQLNHANWGENFTFNRVAESPAGVKPTVNTEAIPAGKSMREVLGDGSYGGEYQVDDVIMQAMFMRVVDEVIERLHALSES
jgi:creatinine amidohydrolase